MFPGGLSHSEQAKDEITSAMNKAMQKRTNEKHIIKWQRVMKGTT